MDEIKRFAAVPGMGATTAKLIDALKAGKVGDVLADEQLKAVCGHDTTCGGKGYSNLCTAMRHCVDAYAVVWQRQRGTNSIKCLSSGERLEAVRGERKAIHRKAGRSLKKLTTVVITDLDPEEQKEALATQALMGAVCLFSKSTTTKALQTRNVTEPPKLEAVLKMFAT